MTTIDELIIGIKSEDEKIRRKSTDDIYDISSNNPKDLSAYVLPILDQIQTTSDEYVVQKLGSTIGSMAEVDKNLGIEHFNTILKTISNLAENYEMAEENNDPAGLSVVHLLESIRTPLTVNNQQFNQALPTLFKIIEKKHVVRYSAYGLVAPAASRNPRIVADYTDKIFQIVRSGFTELTSLLMQLYKFKPDVYEKNLDFLIHLVNDMNYQSLALMIINEMAKKNSRLINPHINDLKGTLHSPQTANLTSMIFGEIARNNPDLIYPLIPDFKEAMKYDDNLKMMAPNIFGLVGRSSPETASEVLPYLAELLEDTDQNVISITLNEMRNIGDMNRSLLEPYKKKIQTFVDDPQEYVRDQANLIIDYLEGRDFRTLAANIEEQNEKIKEVVHSMDDLKNYVDENVAQLKDFIADITKKLPIPSEFSTEGRIRKTMKLYFGCGIQAERCLFPSDRPFTTETKAWSKWLKIALSATKIGAAIITPSVAGGAIGAVKEAYEAYKTKDDTNFISYISEPFLTSEEQDQLIIQLRKARFFEMFNYNSQKGNWFCIMCHPPGS